MAATVLKWLLGTPFSALTTEIISLASGSTVSSSVGGSSGVFSSTQTGGYPECDISLSPVTGSNMTANSLWQGYFLRQVDGTTYETQAAALVRAPDFLLQMTAATSGMFTANDVQNLPAENFKVALTNSSGVSTSSSGSVLTITPKTRQFV